MNVALYSHTGSENHGCEAIVRGMCEILKKHNISLLSLAVHQDVKYNLNDICNICPSGLNFEKNKFFWFVISIMVKMGLIKRYVKEFYNVKYMDSSDVGISIGGDIYCYTGQLSRMAYVHSIFNRKSIPTILWGCSIEESVLNDELLRDLNDYTAIIARESLTYHNLLKSGLNNVYLYPDPAFLMPYKVCKSLDSYENIVGLNLSPLIMNYTGDKTIIFNSYKKLISHILKRTNYTVALIPHVVWKGSDDRIPLSRLKREFSHEDRVLLLKDHSAPELKYIISKCMMFIGSRTHATIAAYSSCVPTLVIGYSVKARGIAIDLFGTDENYVLPIQSICHENQLIDSYSWLNNNRKGIALHLKRIMPEYINNAKNSINIFTFLS